MTTSAVNDFLKKYLIASIFVGVSVLLLGGIIFRSGEIPAREQVVEQKTAEGRRLQANITNSALLREHVETLVQVDKQISQQLVNPNQMAENLQFFYRIEAASGAKIVDVRQIYNSGSAKGQTGSYVPVPYTVQIQGDFRKTLNFARKIEKGSRIGRIMTASFGQSGNTEHTAGDLFSMSLNVELLGIP